MTAEEAWLDRADDPGDGRQRPCRIGGGLRWIGPRRGFRRLPDQVGFIVGDLVDAETMVWSGIWRPHRHPNVDCRQDEVASDMGCRARWLFNTTMPGSSGRGILLVGANPRHEAPLVERPHSQALAAGLATGQAAWRRHSTSPIRCKI